MGEPIDRRARKKARTREEIRGVAQRLFAERGFEAVTIADIAAQADVAVQTVFNHFPTKEELFFDERVPWVDGIAAAVRDRAPDVAPVMALRHHLVQTVRDRVAAHAAEEHRRYVTTIEASAALRAYERELLHVAEIRLAAALMEAWADGLADPPGTRPAEAVSEPATVARVTAALWVTAARVLVLDRRSPLLEGGDAARAAAEAADLADRLLSGLEQGLRDGVGLCPAI